MLCPACGVEVVEAAIFCHKCGHQLAKQDSQTDQISADSTAPALKPAEKFKEAAAKLSVGDEPEEELWRGGYSPKAMIEAWCLSGLISIGLLIIGFLWVRQAWYWVILLLAMLIPWIYNLAKLIYRRLSVRYLLTNQRFIHESGILRRVTDRIEVIDMDDITFEQKIFERMVGVGTIKIASSDRTHPELILSGIENVGYVSGLIDDTRRAERRRRGLHIESI
ncbi:MAG TPA: PH domain-containing protein [Thermoguttaceae bacterium]